MRNLTAIVTLAIPTLLSAPGTDDAAGTEKQEFTRPVATSLDPTDANETILLVSLDDGSVIMQTINSSADICFKNNSVSSTTCLTRGAPVVDPSTDTIIGFEMVEDQIELVAR